MKDFSKYFRPLFILLSALGMIYGSISILSIMQKRVEGSYNSFPSISSNPDTLLQHAKTFYWWARYRNNTKPEFDSAIFLAQKAQVFATDAFKNGGDTNLYLKRVRQSKQILNASGELAEASKSNISTVVPFYMEIMGHDELFSQEDADPGDVPAIAIRGAFSRFEDIMSPERTVPLLNRPGFLLLNVHTSNPLAKEILTQELSSRGRFYIISDHELVNVFERDSIDRSQLIKDTLSLRRITESFKSEEIAVLDFQEYDRVNGIYHYGIRLNLWSRSGGWYPREIYTEFMIRDRSFNQVTIFIIPLFIAFGLLAISLNLIISLISTIFGWSRGIYPLYMLICYCISALIQYVLIKFILQNFLNPNPFDYYASDKAEAWFYIFPFIFILPIFLTYLILGKLDNIIKSFRSLLDNPIAIFAVITGSLLTIPLNLTYYQLLRFGINLQVDNWIILTVILLLNSALAARSLSTIINFPASVHIARRFFAWFSVFMHVMLLYLLLLKMMKGYDYDILTSWFLMTLLPMALILEGIWLFVVFITRPAKQILVEKADSIKPDGLSLMQLDQVNGRLLFVKENIRYASLYISAKRGMDLSQVKSHFGIHTLEDCYEVNFSMHKPSDTDVHYYPFALAFEKRLAFSKFNDAAETARKTTNILGRLISAFTNAGTVLIDDSNTKARDPEELAPVLMDILQKRPTVLVLDHLEEIDEENLHLVECLTAAIHQHVVRKRRYMPAILAMGYGEYGNRDKILAMFEKLSSLQMQGCLEFKINYNAPASRFLQKLSAPIQVKLHLDFLFRSYQRNDVPENIKRTVDEMTLQGKLFHDPVTGLLFSYIDQLRELPEIDHLIGNAYHRKGNEQVIEAMTAASYIADSNGRFHLQVLAYVLDIGMMQLLRILKEAEQQNLVYDLKHRDFFWWYEFTDKALISDFKHHENPRQEKRSQLSKEYIRRFVLFHCPVEDSIDNMRLLKEQYEQGIRDIDLLWLLARRSHVVHPAFPELAFYINFLAATIINNNAVSHYDKALICCSNCIEISSRLNPKTQAVLTNMICRIRLIQFKLTLEMGRQKESGTETDILYNIKNAYNEQLFDASQMREFRFLYVKYCFIDFTLKHQIEANQLLNELSCELLNESEQIRVLFYKIKLVPGKELDLQTSTSLKICLDLHYRYEEILRRLEKLDLSDVESRLLYKEVLNDFAGSFLSDKVLSHFQPEFLNHAPPFVQEFIRQIGFLTHYDLYNRIRELLTRRLQLDMLFKIDQQYSNDPFNNKCLVLFLSDKTHNIDIRGLCYTLNYMSRTYSYVGKWQECLDVVEMSYRFNREVGDVRGEMIASGFAGKACEALGRLSEAFGWYEKSYGHGWMINHYSVLDTLFYMCRIAHATQDKEQTHLSNFYILQQSNAAISAYIKPGHIDESFAISQLLSRDYFSRRETKTLPDSLISWSINANNFLEEVKEIFINHPDQLTYNSNNGSKISEISKLRDFDISIGDLTRRLPEGIVGKTLLFSNESLDYKMQFHLFKINNNDWHLLKVKEEL